VTVFTKTLGPCPHWCYLIMSQLTLNEAAIMVIQYFLALIATEQ
jgi:hypothetical protein